MAIRVTKLSQERVILSHPSFSRTINKKGTSCVETPISCDLLSILGYFQPL